MYKITIIVEDESENIICNLSTTAGINDFEENIVRKVEHSIKAYEEDQEMRAQNEADRQAEELAEKENEERDPERDEADAVDLKIDKNKEEGFSPTGL
jgi:hypothetical protein